MLYKLTWPLMKFFMRVTFGVLGGIRHEGQDNIPKSGGVLICPNHFSDADPAAVAVALPRNAWFMAKAELFDIPIMGSLIRLWHGFPVKRDSADRSALRRAEELLKAGEAVVIFPEGGGNADGMLQPLHPGALMIALRANVPVIPVALKNTDKMWTYADPLPHRSGIPVSVQFGAPLDLSDLEGKRGAIEKATARLTETLAKMLEQPVPVGKPKRREEKKENEAGEDLHGIAVDAAGNAAAAPPSP